MDIKIDFYRPSITSTNPIPFEQALACVGAIPEGENRIVTINGNPVFLKRIEQQSRDGSLWIGDFVRLKDDEPAIKGNRDGKLSTIPLTHDEALSSMTAFLYDSVSGFFCLQRSRSGLGPGGVAKYLSNKSNLNGILALNVVIAPDAMSKIQKMIDYRTLEFSLATTDSLRSLRKELPSVFGSIATAKAFHAPKLSVKIGMGRGKGGLHQVLAAVRELLARKSNLPKSVDHIKVHGTDPETDRTEVIDLIANRVRYSGDVELSHNEEEWYTRRRAVLVRAWQENRVELGRFYSKTQP